MIYNLESLRTLRRFQQNESAEAWILHNIYPTGSAAIYREARKERVPLIQYVHNFRPLCVSYLQTTDLDMLPSRLRTYLTEIKRGAWQDSRIKTAWFATVLSIAHLLGWFNAVNAWIAVSDFMRDQFIKAGIAPDKIFTLRHFWRPSVEIPVETFGQHYLFLGRLVEAKGILVLLDVWDLIWRDRKHSGPRLVICGDGPLRESTEARAAANPLVEFKGVVSGEAKRRLVSEARAVIAPSICLESLGLVAYESYEFAKPVLASRTGGLGEIVMHNQTGLVHEPGDIATLYEHAMTLEDEPAKRMNFGRNGLDWLRENTDEGRWLLKFNEIVEFAIATSRK